MGAPVPTTLQVAAAYRFALGREPTVRERIVALAFLEREAKRWSEMQLAEPLAATEAACETPADRALAELCKLLLNLNEFVYID